MSAAAIVCWVRQSVMGYLRVIWMQEAVLGGRGTFRVWPSMVRGLWRIPAVKPGGKIS